MSSKSYKSHFEWSRSLVISAFLAIFASICFVGLFLERQHRHNIAEQALDWMQYQKYPDNCGFQGEFPYPSVAMPCFSKNGYRFLSGTDTYGEWSTPFRRIVKIKPDDKWTMGDIIVSWTNDWLPNRMQLRIGSSADLDALLEAIPEIGRGWPYHPTTTSQ